MGLIYRLIYMKALGDSNEAITYQKKNFFFRWFGIGSDKKDYLVTIWKKLKSRPISPYMPYFQSDKMASRWRNYQNNEIGDRSLFRTMDRGKLIFSIITDTIDIYSLTNIGFLEEFTPLHDMYHLFHEKQIPQFEKTSFYKAKKYPPSFDNVIKFMENFNDEAEVRDFLDEPLKTTLKFRCFNWTYINIPAIQNYFGEKIALYFTFLHTYTLSLRFLGIIGIIPEVIEQLFIYGVIEGNDWENVVKYGRLIFSFLIILWATIFTEKWKAKETLFAIEYGQTDYENKEQERPGFRGYYKRNFANDQMNHLTTNQFWKNTKVFFGIIIALIIAALSVATSVGILFLKVHLEKEYAGDDAM